MSIKQILIVIVLAILIGGTAIFFISKQNQVSQNTSTSKSLNSEPVESTPTPVTLATWTDEAGFSFQYPEGTQINQHPEDTKNYANLTLTFPSSDTVNIIMSDNTFKDLNAWTGQNLAIDTSLGGKTAKKIIKDGQTTVACIDNEVIVNISGKDISSIIDSWNFIYPTPTISKTTKTTTTTTDSGNVLEEE